MSDDGVRLVAKVCPDEVAELLMAEARRDVSDIFYLSSTVDDAMVAWVMLNRWTHDSSASTRNKCKVFITTNGGSPGAAYIIARHLQEKYESVIAYVFGKCKSAGTMLALGANEIVIGDRGELGPLDMQRPKEDEIQLVSSGLEITHAIDELRWYTMVLFDNFLRNITEKGITTRTAAKIATDLVSAVISPIAQQIDPVQLSIADRAIQEGTDYLSRLNIPQELRGELARAYAAHNFVIDRKEMMRLCAKIDKEVREPTEDERSLEIQLSQHLPSFGLYRQPPKKHRLFCIISSTENAGDADEQAS